MPQHTGSKNNQQNDDHLRVRGYDENLQNRVAIRKTNGHLQIERLLHFGVRARQKVEHGQKDEEKQLKHGRRHRRRRRRHRRRRKRSRRRSRLAMVLVVLIAVGTRFLSHESRRRGS